MLTTVYYIPITIIFIRCKVLSTWHRQGAFIFAGPKKIFVVENALYFPIGIVQMRKDASFWRTMPLKFRSKWNIIDYTFRIFQQICARMTHFGENTEFIEDDPVNLMLPSDSTKTYSILNYPPPKFQSYENCTSQTQGKRLVQFQHQTHTSDPNTIHKIVIKPWWTPFTISQFL